MTPVWLRLHVLPGPFAGKARASTYTSQTDIVTTVTQG